MIIYYISLFFLTVSGYYLCTIKNTKTNKIIYLFLAGIIFTAFVSFRYAIGFDYYSYRNIFYMVKENSFIELFSIFPKEPLFVYLTKLISYFGGTYHIFLFLTGVFIHISAMYFIFCYSKLPWVSIYFYITFQFLAHNMNLIRQSIAVAFVLLSYPFLKKKKFFPYMILILLGSGFHQSVLCMLIFYFLLHYTKSLRTVVLVSGITFIGYFSIDYIIEIIQKIFHFEYLEFYKDSYYWQGNSIKYVILPACYFFIVLFFKKRLLENDSNNIILINTAFYNFLICIFITKHFILERFSVYLFIFSILLIPEIIFVSKYKKITTFLFLSIGFFYFLFAVKEGFHNVYPYISLLDKAGGI